MPKKTKNMLFFSDPHVWSSEGNARLSRLRILNAPGPGKLGTLARRRELERLGSLIAGEYDPQEWMVLIGGDIVEGGMTNRTRKMEYKNAGEALKPLVQARFEVQMVPGNHDFGPAGWWFSQDAYNRYRALHNDICGYDTTFPHTQDYGDWRLILLDSTAHHERGQLFARGRIGLEQLAVLGVELKDPKPAVIAMHHHPVLRRLNRRALEVVDSQELMAVIAVARSPVIICCGHKHARDLAFRRTRTSRGIAADKSTDTFAVIQVHPLAQEASVDTLKP